MPEFLLEVGFEEMPARWLPGLADQLGRRFAEAAGRARLDPKETVETFWTPRRLVLRADLVARQADSEERVWGPALPIAQDVQGKWLPPALGFAKKQGRSIEDLQIGDKGQPLPLPPTLYIYVDKKTLGESASDVVPALIAEVLRGLTFPKRMNWDAWIDDGKGAFAFGRPIRWLVALLGGTVIPFMISELENGAKGKARVAAGPATLGHRFLPKGTANKPLTVRSFAELREALRRNFVLLDPAERAARIEDGLTQVSTNMLVRDVNELRVEWRDLVEYPTVVRGGIPEEFQALPQDVITTVLVHHQKYIPLGVRGANVAGFAAVTNTDGSADEKIRRGMERVVVARLRDASFFYGEDLKRSLADRVADLAGVTFQKGLGTYKDKAERLVRLVEAMGDELGLLGESHQGAAAEAARLAKADLTTLMVREFPELQGTMGGIYLRAQGASPDVAEAVRWHYHPIALGKTDSPDLEFLETGANTRVFAAVSVADKLDTLAGYFGLGLNPTGSSDPFGLRRAAQGATRAILDFWGAKAGERHPDLRRLIAAAVAGYPNAKRPPAEVAKDLEAFLLDRLSYLLTLRGFPAEEVEAALQTPGANALEDPLDALVRVEALHRVRAQSQEDFAHLAVAFKRAKNILTQQAAAAAIEPRLFEHDAERELHKAVGSLGGLNGDYEARLRSLSALRAPVDRFFDDVLVMAEDPKVRGNRLALLNQTLSLFYRIADISKLGGQS